LIEEETTGTPVFAALREAIERRNPDALLDFYAEDAGLRIEHVALPDCQAFELKGRAQIERYLRTVCAQQMACVVVGWPVFGEGNVSFVETCEYPDGTRISVGTTLELGGGKISHQLDVVERLA
jgi:ketosteroid isomerase-like protein